MKACSLLLPEVEHTDDRILEALSKLRYPVLATLKKDGIRAVRTSDLFSCTMHLIPNISIRRRSMKLPPGFDCELWNPELSYDEIESIVMTGKEEHPLSDKIQFHVLDWYTNTDTYTRPYANRMFLTRNMLSWQETWTDVVFQYPMEFHSAQALFDYFIQCEQQEGEGICFRLPNSPYKQGRSTLKEQYLVKLCRYVRSEVTIIGFEEQLLNKNTSKRNPIGMMDRSSRKSGLIGKGTLGAFLVRDINGLEFRVGTGVGLTDQRRLQIWQEQYKWIGKQITIKHKPHGQKIKPRSPVYVGKREDGF
jgi:DNA ligase-1